MGKLFFDYFPIVCFFIAYKIAGVYVATTTAIIATFLQVSVFWLYKRKFETTHLIILAIVVILGGATLWFHNPKFVQWKPSIIYWLFSITLLWSQYIGKKKNILKKLMGKTISLPNTAWKKMSLQWAIFFLIMGGLNIYVAYHFSLSAWVDFKLFGTLGLSLLFIVFQAFQMKDVISSETPNK